MEPSPQVGDWLQAGFRTYVLKFYSSPPLVLLLDDEDPRFLLIEMDSEVQPW